MNGNSMIGVTSCFVIKGKVNRQVIYLNGIVYYNENIKGLNRYLLLWMTTK
jgi:hypothetical protein